MAKTLPKSSRESKPKWIVRALSWVVVRVENGKETTLAVEGSQAKALKRRKQMKREWGE